MTSRLANERILVSAFLVVFLCRAAIANALVPPWQGPDEPTHFSLAFGLMKPAGMQQRVEADVIQSMVRYRWWELYDRRPPNPLPKTLFEAGLGPGLLNQPLYYGLAATVLRISSPADLDTAYRHLRLLSVLLAVATLAFGWAGTRVLFGPEVAYGATGIAVLHPQFLLASISVNADALLNLLGAFVWWQAAHAMTGQRRGFSAILMLVGALAALFTKRIGMVLVGVAIVVALESFVANRTRGITRRDALLVMAVGIVAASVLSGAGFVFQDQVPTLWRYWADALSIKRSLRDATLQEAFTFARTTVDHSWLIAGWLRFQPPDVWIWIARALIIGGMAGAAARLIESPAERPRLSIPWLFVVAQGLGMYVAVFWTNPSSPQARYLFPVFTPITVLLYIGLQRTLLGPFHRHWPSVQRYWPAGLFVVLVLMDMTGFTSVHIPTYLP